MNLPNSIKVLWWLILLSSVSGVLYTRLGAVTSGDATTIDGLIIVVWLGLALAPIFNEINVFGLQLKQDLENFKSDVDENISQIRTELNTYVSSNNQQNTNVHILPPVAQLSEVAEENFNKFSQGVSSNDVPAAKIEAGFESAISDDDKFLITAKFALENQLKSAYNTALAEGKVVGTALLPLVKPLKYAELLEHIKSAGYVGDAYVEGFKAAYQICEGAAQGQELKEYHVEFVRKYAPKLLATLINIQEKK